MDKLKRQEYQRQYYKEHRSSQLLRRKWGSMRQRCSNPKVPNYKYYGGRGIRVCDEWRNDYRQFEHWALKNGYRPDLQIDRIDNNGDYESGNCRFVKQKEQMRNCRSNINLTFQGKTQCLSHWANEIGISRQTLDSRLRFSGWSVEEALSQPLGVRRNMSGSVIISFQGKTQCLSAWARELGIARGTINSRLNLRGWTVEKALTREVNKRLIRQPPEKRLSTPDVI